MIKEEVVKVPLIANKTPSAVLFKPSDFTQTPSKSIAKNKAMATGSIHASMEDQIKKDLKFAKE